MTAASYAPKKIPVCFPVRRHVTSDHVALRVDPVALGGNCARDINGDELPIAQDKAVLVSILTVVETDDVSLRAYARNPCEGRVGNVDGGELSCLPQETMKYTVANVAMLAVSGWGWREKSTGDDPERGMIVRREVASLLNIANRLNPSD
jgi:hypothetical protein